MKNGGKNKSVAFIILVSIVIDIKCHKLNACFITQHVFFD